MSNFNYIFLKTLTVVAIGFLLKKTGVLSIEHGKSLSRIILNITLPALILQTISKIELDFSLFLAPVICISHSLVVTVLSGFLFKNEVDNTKGISRMCSVGFNVGLFAYPIISGIFGSSGLSAIAMFDFGNGFVVFGLSYFLGFIYSKSRADHRLTFKEMFTLFGTSIPFMSYLIAIIVNLAGFRFSGFASDVLEILAQANTGMALVVLGLTLDFRFESSSWKLITKVLLLRYTAGFVAGLLLYLLLPFSHLYRTVILFGLILPVGMAVIPYSVEFEYDTRIAGTIANLTMITSFALMWFFMILVKPV